MLCALIDRRCPPRPGHIPSPSISCITRSAAHMWHIICSAESRTTTRVKRPMRSARSVLCDFFAHPFAVSSSLSIYCGFICNSFKFLLKFLFMHTCDSRQRTHNPLFRHFPSITCTTLLPSCPPYSVLLQTASLPRTMATGVTSLPWIPPSPR